MSVQKATVQRYMDGFRAGDREAVGATLTDDVKWRIHGFRSLEGKSAFLEEMGNAAFVGLPKLIEDRVVEEGDVVALMGSGEAELAAGGSFRFRFSDVFVFRDELIAEVESYVVALQ